MADVNKIPIGTVVRTFPANTFNRLIEAEIRNRSASGDGGSPTSRQHQPAIVRLRWEGADGPGIGHCVKLGAALLDPTDPDTAHAPFAGLQFNCEAFTEDETIRDYAITLAAIEDDGMGWGVMPQAWWAKVLLAANAHTHAKVATAGTMLESATAGGLRMIWHPTVEELDEEDPEPVEVWAVVAMAGGGGGGDITRCVFETTGAIPPSVDGDPGVLDSAFFAVILGTSGGSIHNYSDVEIEAGVRGVAIEIGGVMVLIAVFCGEGV